MKGYLDVMIECQGNGHPGVPVRATARCVFVTDWSGGLHFDKRASQLPPGWTEEQRHNNYDALYSVTLCSRCQRAPK